jgi:hypothetical protein
MKNTCLMMIFLFNALKLFAQSPLTYQLRLNVIPIKDFAYAGAGRIGIETTNRKYNIGVDLMTFRVDQHSATTYTLDSVFRRTRTTTNVNAQGLAFNVSRAYRFKNNNNKWISGVQVFAGASRQINTEYKEIFDTTYSKYSSPHWVNPTFNQLGDYRRHGPKLNFAVSIFARLQLEINRRFTFTPELQLPLTIDNRIGGDVILDLFPGFNFCLGYRFGKENTKKSLNQQGYNSL